MAQNNTELKPCPFCGGAAAYKTGTTNRVPNTPTVFVKCIGCGATTRLFEDEKNDGNFLARAREAWNRRAPCGGE